VQLRPWLGGIAPYRAQSFWCAIPEPNFVLRRSWGRMTYPIGPRPSSEDRLREMQKEKEYLLIQLEKLEADIQRELGRLG
jgi:hypothetical protein